MSHTKDELYEEATRRKIRGRSQMTKQELTEAVDDARKADGGTPRGGWLHDHALSVALFTLFVASWVGQLWFQYREEIHLSQQHGEPAPAFFSGEFWTSFMSATLENWQSEFLQLFTFVVLATYLIHRNSPQSRDGNDEMQADIKAIKAKLGA
jgi:hypothetical protein